MNFSGYSSQVFSVKQFRLEDYDIEGTINDSLNCYYAYSKQDKSDSYALKKIIFPTAQDRQACINQYQNQVQSSTKGIILPKGYSIEMKDDNQHILNLLYERRESSLKDEIERRQRTMNYFSTSQLRNIFEYSFEQLFKLTSEKLHHLNIKTSNLLINAQGTYSLSEGGYPSQNICIDNDVFRSPQFIEDLKKKKPITQLSQFEKESADIFSLGMSFVQAATLLPAKELKCFNDESAMPQQAKDILETINKRYGKDIYSLLNVMSSFDDEKRSNLEDIKNREFRSFRDSNDREYQGGNDGSTPLQSQEASPEDQAFLKKIKGRAAQYCEEKQQSMQEYFDRSEGFDKITKTITKYEFRRLLEQMNIRLADYEVKSINRVLDPQETGKYNMVEFFKDANSLGQSTRFLSNAMKDDLPQLGSEQEELLLQAAMKRIYNFVQREKINLERLLKEEDSRQSGYLTFEQFNKVMNNNGIIFKEPEFNCIKIKFDLEFKKERINYIKFYEAFQKSVQVDDKEVKESLNEVFQSIYKNFKSFDDFIVKQSKDGQNYMSFHAFTTYLNHDGLNLTDNMINKLKQILDPPNSGQIYVQSVKEVFQNNVEKLIEQRISDLANQIDRKNLSFNGFISTYLPKSFSIKVATFAEKCYDVLKCNIERKDMTFMLEYFKIDVNYSEEFNINKLKEQIANFAKTFKINYAQQIFSDAAAPPTSDSPFHKRDSVRMDNSQSDREMGKSTFGKKSDSSFSSIISQLKDSAKRLKRQDILQYYGLTEKKNIQLNFETFKKNLSLFQRLEEQEISILFNQLARNINNGRFVDSAEFLGLLDVKVDGDGDFQSNEQNGGINYSELQKYSAVFIEINRLLKSYNSSARNHFSNTQSVVQRYFIEEKLKDLRFKVDDFGRELDMIFQILSGSLNKVEISKFVDAINNFADIANTKVALMENKSTIIWFIKIFQAMKDEGVNLNQFNRLVNGGDRINKDDFNSKIQRDLRLRQDEAYNIFLDSISHKNGDISNSKFEEGYFKEEKAQRALNDMRSMTKSSSKVISQAFSNIDINGDGQISKAEFYEMMPIINSSLKKEDLEYLFDRMDLNSSGFISLDEFRDNIQGKDALKNQQEFEQINSSFYQDLQDTLIRSKQSFDDVFFNNSDKQMNIAEFEKILSRIGFNIDNKQKMNVVLEDLAFGGLVFNKMRFKKRYEKYYSRQKEEQFSRSNNNNNNNNNGRNNNNNNGNVNNDKQDAYEFVKIIKQNMSKKNIFFDEIFNKKRGYTKSDFSDLLSGRIDININRYIDLYDSFWKYFKDSYNNELDFQVFEDAFNQTRYDVGSNSRTNFNDRYNDRNNNNRDNDRNNNNNNRDNDRYNNNNRDNDRNNNRDNDDRGMRGGGINQILDRFLNQNYDDCYDEFSKFHQSSIRVNEFIGAMKKAGLSQSLNPQDIEDYCDSYKVILKNREIDYQTLLDKVKRKQRDEQGYNNNNRRDDNDWDRNNNNKNRVDDRNGRNNNNNDDDYPRRQNDRNNNNNRDSDRDFDNDSRYNDNRGKNDRDNNNNNRFKNEDRNQNNDIKRRSNYDRKDYQLSIKNLLDLMIKNKCNILDTIKEARLDKYNEGVVDEKDFWSEMRLKSVKLSADDEDAINSFVCNTKGQLDYKKLDGDIRSFIEEQRKGKGDNNNNNNKNKIKKKKIKQDQLTKILDEFRKDMNQFVKSKNVGTRYAFKKFDKDNDGYISFSEFENALRDNRLLPFFEQYESIDGIVENIFDIFDEDKELKIDLSQFTKVLFPEQNNMEISPLVKQFKSLLSGTSEENLRKEYATIDKNEDGKISYSEFQKYVKQLTKGKMTDVEIERLFQHFLQDKGLDYILFDHFVAVVQDDHMNFEKIRQKIIEYKDKKDRTLKSIYDQYSGPQGSINLHSLQMFFQVLKLEFNMDQLDELFSFLDTNGDGMITYDEFYNAIEKAEVSQFQLLKRMRRDFVKAKCDIAKELSNRALGKDTVYFGDFKDLLSQFKVEVKPFELDALYKRFGRGDSILYHNFLQELLSNKYDIDPIKKKINQYIMKENISYQQFFDLFANTPDLLGFAEFQNLLLQCEANIPKDEVLEAFSAFDLNNSRKIHKNEFIDVLEGRISPQAAIGFNNMLQNALNYQPVYQMEQSVMLMSNLQGPGTPGGAYNQYAGYLDNHSNIAQSQYIQSQFFPPKQPLQQGQQPSIIPSQFGNNQGTLNAINDPIQEEITLKGDCSIEEIIETIRQVCNNKMISPFHLFIAPDKKFICGYQNDTDFEEIMNSIGITARSSHYLEIQRRFEIKQKKIMAYLNIVKEMIGLSLLVKMSIIHAIKIQETTLEIYIDNILKTFRARTLTLDVFKGFVQQTLNVTSNDQEIDECYQQIMTNQQKDFTVFDTMAAYLQVTKKYDGRIDKCDKIDVFSNGRILLKIKQICAQIRISPIDLFQFYNKEGTYKMQSNIFAKILDDLDIKTTTKEAISLVQQYQLEDEVRILPLVDQIQDFPEMFRKICLNAMKCNVLSFEAFFSFFSFDKKFSKWSRAEIKYFLNQFSFHVTDKEIFHLYNLICQEKNDIYPKEMAAFLGLTINMQGDQVKQYYESIFSNIQNTLYEYNTNRQAFLNKIGSKPLLQTNPFDQNNQQSFLNPSSQPMINIKNTTSLNQFDHMPMSRTDINYQDPKLIQNNQQQKQVQFQNQYDDQRFNQQGQYDQKRQYDQYDPVPQNQYNQQGQFNQSNQFNASNQFNQQNQFQPRNNGQIDNRSQYDQFNENRLAYDLVNKPKQLIQSELTRPDQYDQNLRKSQNQLDPYRNQDRQYDQRDNYPQQQQQQGRNLNDNYSTPQGGQNRMPSQQNFEQDQKKQRAIEQELSILSDALNKIGGFELIQRGGREQLLNVNQIEQILIKHYKMLETPEFHILVDSLIDQSGMISVDEIFRRTQYDHKRFVDNIEINKQFGVGNKQQLQPSQKASGQNDKQKVDNLRLMLLDMYKNDFIQLSETFFMGGPLIDLQNFLSTSRQIFQNAQYMPTDKELEWLFNEIDANSGGTITFNEFELYFADSQEAVEKSKHKKFCITSQMEQEIQELFRIVDIDNNQQISVDELNILFSKIGSNASPQEIDEYIRRYDKNNDRSISYEEFKIIMEEKIKNEMLTSESVIDDLKREFRKVDLNNSRCLNIGQLGQVLNNLGMQVKPSELSALFNEIDIDGSKTVDIDELISFITRNSDGASTLAQTAILNIRSSRKFSIKDLLDTFKQMPANYRLSFLRNQNQKGFNLPSSTLRPKVTASQIYSDLHYDNPGMIDNNMSVLDRKYNPPMFQMEFTIKLGTGIPLPDENAFPRDQISKREAYISFYDTNRQFIGNICKLDAQWSPEYEDRWNFQLNRIDQSFIARYVGYDKLKHGNLNICIELVMHYIPKKSNSKCDLEISVSHVLIPLQNLTKTEDLTFNLVGGEPSKPATINPEDVRAKRKGFTKSIVKAFTKKIESQIQISVNTNIQNKNLINDMSIMPDQIIVRKSNLPLITTYREYFGFRSICKKEIDTNLPCDPIFKTFSKVIDCPDTINAVSDFWRQEILPKMNRLEDLKITFEKIMKHLNLLFNSDKFMFSPNDPTASVNCFPSVQNERNRLIGNCLEDLKIITGIKPGQPQNLKVTDCSVPFSIDELLDDNQEDDNMMYQEFLNRKTNAVYSK